MLRYVGGEKDEVKVDGKEVPRRNLSDEEVAAAGGQARLVATGLFKPIVLLYGGSGYFIDVPARDLTEDDLARVAEKKKVLLSDARELGLPEEELSRLAADRPATKEELVATGVYVVPPKPSAGKSQGPKAGE